MPSAGSPGSTPTRHADWEQAIAAATHLPAPTTKSNTALTDFAALFGAITTSQTLWMSYVSDPLDVDQTITGDMNGLIVRCLEGGSGEDAHLCFELRVMQGNTSTERGLLVARMNNAVEFATAAPATRVRASPAIAVTSVAALAGDRIVLEVGVHGITPTNAANITLRFGDPTGTADFAFTEGLTTDLDPWFELSQNLTFGTPSSGPFPPFAQRRIAVPA